MMTTAARRCLFVAVAMVSLGPGVGGNPVADPAYELVEEQVEVTLGSTRSLVHGTFKFLKTGILFGAEERASKMVAVPDGVVEGLVDNVFTVNIYVPVFAGTTWSVGPEFHGTVDMSATICANRLTQNRVVAMASGQDITKSVKRFLVPVEGCKPVWFRISLPPQYWPDSFTLEISYTQPGIVVGKQPVFAYMPLLPAGKTAAQGNYRIRVVPPEGKEVRVLSTNRFAPSRSDSGGLDFWPVDEEPIVVAVAGPPATR